MLILFAFSIVPKQFLHDIIADHTDTIACKDDLTTRHIHSAGFYCACDNLVAESAFTNDLPSIELSTPAILTEYTPVFARDYYFIADLFIDLRGPPPVVA
ncbi:MAG: hypothetical protein QM802_02885 [Agriterribacter sp.]